jgi:hypothetical protein
VAVAEQAEMDLLPQFIQVLFPLLLGLTFQSLLAQVAQAALVAQVETQPQQEDLVAVPDTTAEFQALEV